MVLPRGDEVEGLSDGREHDGPGPVPRRPLEAARRARVGRGVWALLDEALLAVDPGANAAEAFQSRLERLPARTRPPCFPQTGLTVGSRCARH